jgi:hypothetical protein
MKLSNRINRLEAKARGGADGCVHCRGAVQMKFIEDGSKDHTPNTCPYCGLKGMVIVIEYVQDWRSK